MLEFRKLNTIKEKLKVRNVEYVLYHISTEGNIAYINKASLGSKQFLIEIVKLADSRWYFHVENKETLIFDSRIGNAYYSSASDTHTALINAILEKYERKESAKFTKIKSTKKR
jgi:hypothetical protein